MKFTLKDYFSKTAILLGALIVLYIQLRQEAWKEPNKVIVWDVVSYYGYLPSAFIYNDLTLDFAKEDPGKFATKIWFERTGTGGKVFRTSMGTAMMYAPFFFGGHFFAINSEYEADGFSAPYRFALLFSSFFFLIVGLIFLRKLLRLYFPDSIVAITILAILFGTNLLYFATFKAAMSHCYSFSLVTIFLFLTAKWYKKQHWWKTILLGFIAGLIALIRPTNILVLLVFAFWGVTNGKEFFERFMFFIRKFKHILLMIVFFFIAWTPQMIYWKILSGQWLYYSYGVVGFHFDNPQIINGLFSYRKGWLLYTPIMILALIGIFILFKKHKKFFFPVLLFTIFNIWVVFSWWCWWYGGSFSQRAMIDSYGIMAIPLAAFFDWARTRKIVVSVASFFIAGVFFILGIFYTIQFYHGAIHWDSQTKESFWCSFGKVKPCYGFYSLIEKPDPNMALRGIQTNMKEPRKLIVEAKIKERFTGSMEWAREDSLSLTNDSIVSGGYAQYDEIAFQGNYCIRLNKDFPFALNYTFENVKCGEYFRIDIWRWPQNAPGTIVASATNPEDFYTTGKKVVNKAGNGWEMIELEFFVDKELPDGKLKFYLWNPKQEPVYFDNLFVERLSSVLKDRTIEVYDD